MTRDAGDARTFTFRRAHRLTHALEFQRVREGGVRVSKGPVLFVGVANELGHARLGLTVGRRVGTAVRRNRIKRMLREAFRLERGGFGGVDVVAVVRGHDPLPLARYRAMLVEAEGEIRRRLARREERT